VRAIGRGEPCQTLPFVRPGGDILLKIEGWPKVEAACCRRSTPWKHSASIRPTCLPDHWRHVHNRLTAGHEPRAYTPERHAAWLGRRRIAP
jgi:hypothetical protein